MRQAALFLATASVLLALALFGPQALGRALFWLGFPSAAAYAFEDPAWKGAAFYAAGRWNAAAEAFAADAASAHNLGNALAKAGRFEEAITAYDAALTTHPDDEDAAFNKALLEAAMRQEAGPARGGAEGVLARAFPCISESGGIPVLAGV